MPKESEPVNVADHLARTSKRQPKRLAIISQNEKGFSPKSFAQLEKEVNGCSIVLHEQGIRKGDRVLLMVRPGYGLILLAFALFRLGSPPVVIDPGMGLRNLLACIRRARPKAMIGIPFACLISRVFRGSFREIRLRIVFREKTFLGKIHASASASLKHCANSVPEDLAAILFTSGSTGAPKGVCYEHKTFSAQIDMLKKNFGITEGETDLATLPVFALFNPALGMTTVIPEMDPRRPSRVDPKKLTESIRRHEVNSSFGSPVIWVKVADYCERHDITLPSLKRIFLAGASVPPALVARLKPLLPNAKILMPYGATEALPITVCDSEEAISLRSSTEKGDGSCLGKPLPGVEIYILPICNSPIPFLSEVDPLPKGMVGEITVGGPMVTKLYHRMPGATFDAKVQHNDKTLHRMGDLGYFDEKGNLRFLGRKAELVQTESGPLETERAEPVANKLPKVYRSALIGLGSGQTKKPALVVEPAPEHYPKSPEEKKSFAKEVLRTLHELDRLRPIKRIFFERNFPVDSRHNAKIHRLALARKWSKKTGVK